MGVRGVAFLAALVVVGFVAGAVFIGSGPGVKRPRGVPAGAPYVDGLVQRVGVDRVVVKPNGGGRDVTLMVTLQHAGLVDVPHLVNFHQARNEPVRMYYLRRGARRIALGDVDLPGGPVAPPQRF
jgi:hypothetical protein